MRLLILAGLAGCVDQYDPEVFVVLPDVPSACSTIGATRARIALDTADGEHFEVTSDACDSQLANQQVSGFALSIDRITRGYHHATIAIDGDAGMLGSIDRPFAADTPLIVPFGYADLPGWPTAPLALAAECTTMHLTVTPSTANRPALDEDVACTTTLELPRGPLHLEARLTGDTCAAAIVDAFASEPDPVVAADPVELVFFPVECP